MGLCQSKGEQKGKNMFRGKTIIKDLKATFFWGLLCGSLIHLYQNRAKWQLTHFEPRLHENCAALAGILIENSPSCIAEMAIHLMPFLRHLCFQFVSGVRGCSLSVDGTWSVDRNQILWFVCFFFVRCLSCQTSSVVHLC